MRLQKLQLNSHFSLGFVGLLMVLFCLCFVSLQRSSPFSFTVYLRCHLGKKDG